MEEVGVESHHLVDLAVDPVTFRPKRFAILVPNTALSCWVCSFFLLFFKGCKFIYNVNTLNNKKTGAAGVGKTALVSQFMTSEYMNTYDASLGKYLIII